MGPEAARLSSATASRSTSPPMECPTAAMRDARSARPPAVLVYAESSRMAHDVYCACLCAAAQSTHASPFPPPARAKSAPARTKLSAIARRLNRPAHGSVGRALRFSAFSYRALWNQFIHQPRLARDWSAQFAHLRRRAALKAEYLRGGGGGGGAAMIRNDAHSRDCACKETLVWRGGCNAHTCRTLKTRLTRTLSALPASFCDSAHWRSTLAGAGDCPRSCRGRSPP